MELRYYFVFNDMWCILGNLYSFFPEDMTRRFGGRKNTY